MKTSGQLILVTVVTAVITSVFIVDQLESFGGDPSGFARFSIGSAEYAEPLLGEVVVAEGAGHDGKFFFALANDPWLTTPAEHAVWLDAPLYRAQRIMYPMIAGGFGVFPPQVVIWALVILNGAALVIGSFVVGLLAIDLGRTPWLGLAFVLNPGVLFETMIDGSSVLALMFSFAAVLMFRHRNLGVAAVLLAAAILSRETMVLFPLGLALWSVIHERRLRLRFLMVSIAPYLVWMGWASWRLTDVETRFSAASRNLDRPFSGLVEVVPNWFAGSAISILFGLLIVLACGSVVVLSIVRRDQLSMSVAGFGVLPVVLSEAVLAEFFDISRVIAPAITASIVLMAPQVSGTDEFISPAVDSG